MIDKADVKEKVIIILPSPIVLFTTGRLTVIANDHQLNRAGMEKDSSGK